MNWASTCITVEGDRLVVKVSINLYDPEIRQTFVSLGWKHPDMLTELGWTPPPRALLPARTVRILLREGLDTVAKVLHILPKLQGYPGVGSAQRARVQKWLNDRPSDSDLQLERVQEVYSTLAGLTVREQQVLDMRSGLDGAPRTLKAIGDDMGVSVERVRQIEAKALRKLRKFKAKDII